MLDASWSPCGLRLAACSWDGTAVFIEFTRQELGQPLDPAEQVITDALFNILAYSVRLSSYWFSCYCIYRAVFMNDCMVSHWSKEAAW